MAKMVYPVLKLTLWPLLRLFLRKVQGLENLPSPPFVIAANHDSYLDPFFIGSVVIPKLDRKVHFLAMKGRFWDKFGDNICRNWAGCIPLDEGKEKALEDLTALLRKGEIVALFPGGSRSLDGKLKKGRTGAVRLALAADVPLVPVGIKGAFAIAPHDQLIPNLKRAEIKFGRPIYLENGRVSRKLLRSHTDDLMRRIGSLIGEKYRY